MILSDIAEVIMGQAPPGNSYNENGNGLPLLAGASDLGSDFPSPSRFTSEAKKISADGDIILCVRATIGKLNWSDGQYCLGRGVSGIRARDKADSEFLFYFLAANERNLLRKGRGATFKQISKGDITKLEIPEEAYENKSVVVARIQECLGRVEEMERLQAEVSEDIWELFDRALEERIQEAIGDTVTFDSVISIESGLVDPQLPEFKALPHVGVANIVRGTGGLINLQTAEEENLKSGKYEFTPEDVIYSKIRPNLRKVARPDFIGLCSADSYPLRPKPGLLNRDYLFFLLLSRQFTFYAVSGSNRAGIPKVNQKHLMAFEFSLPDLETQETTAASLDEVLCRCSEMADGFRSLSEEPKRLRNAILRQAFAGEL